MIRRRVRSSSSCDAANGASEASRPPLDRRAHSVWAQWRVARVWFRASASIARCTGSSSTETRAYPTEHPTLEEIVSGVADEVIAQFPNRPVHLAGHSFGAHVAYELGQQLRARHLAPLSIVLVDASAFLPDGPFRSVDVISMAANFPRWIVNEWRFYGLAALWTRMRRRVASRAATSAAGLVDPSLAGEDPRSLRTVMRAFDWASLPLLYRRRLSQSYTAVRNYRPRPTANRVVYLRCRVRNLVHRHRPDGGWGRYVADRVAGEVHDSRRSRERIARALETCLPRDPASGAERQVVSHRGTGTRAKGRLGPGLVFFFTAMGPGTFLTSAVAGATYGYSLLWALALALLFRFVWVNTAASYVLVTRESLLQGYARMGRWLVWTALVVTIVVRHSSNLYTILLMGNAAHLLLPLPTPASGAIWSVGLTVLGVVMMVWGGYRLIERVCTGGDRAPGRLAADCSLVLASRSGRDRARSVHSDDSEQRRALQRDAAARRDDRCAGREHEQPELHLLRHGERMVRRRGPPAAAHGSGDEHVLPVWRRGVAAGCRGRDNPAAWESRLRAPNTWCASSATAWV